MRIKNVAEKIDLIETEAIMYTRDSTRSTAKENFKKRCKKGGEHLMNINKNIVIVIVFGVVIIFATWWYVSVQETASRQMMKESQTLLEEQALVDSPMTEEDDETEALLALEEREKMLETEGGRIIKGGYDVYTSSKLSFAQEEGRVVLFFRAFQCATCRVLDENIKANLSQIPSDVLILDVDYDRYADLKKEYGVTGPHTLVQVNDDGTMITKWSGSAALSDLLKQVR